MISSGLLASFYPEDLKSASNFSKDVGLEVFAINHLGALQLNFHEDA